VAAQPAAPPPPPVAAKGKEKDKKNKGKDAKQTAAQPAAAAPAAAPGAAAKPGDAKPAAKPATKKKGMGARAMIAIAAVVVAIGAGVVFMMSGGGGNATEELAADATAASAPVLDTPPVEYEPQPLPPELSADLAPEAAVDATAGATGPQLYRIVTRPIGAAITVDGKLLDGVVTPAEVELPHDAKHLIQLELEGHKPVRWTFQADRLTADQQQKRTLYFPLPAIEVAPPPETQQAKAAPAAPPPPLIAANAQPVVLPSSPAGTLDKDLKTVRGGREVPMPRKIVDAGPTFDRALLPGGKQGVVILELTLDPNGDVAAAKVLSSLGPELDSIAQRTSYRWKYEVQQHRNKPVNTIVTGTVVFEP
jgi:TonB family protein